MTGFVTKDSGQRQQFSSGMQRDTAADKTLYHLVYDGPLLKRWAELLTRGAKKYDEGNWLKAQGPEELKRFKASAARHFFQWYNDEIDEDHAAAIAFNVNGAEYVKGKLAVFPGPLFEKTTPLTDAQAAQIVIDEDKVHAQQTQQNFTKGNAYSLLPYITSQESRAVANKVLYGLGEMKVGIDSAEEDGDRSVYVVGEPGKQVFVVPSDLQADFERITLARNNEAVPVSEDTLKLLRFNGFPVVYTDNLDTKTEPVFHDPLKHLNVTPYDWKWADYSFPVDTGSHPSSLTNSFSKLKLESSPFIDLLRQRIFQAKLDMYELMERRLWAGLPPGTRFEGTVQRPPTFLEKIQDKVNAFIERYIKQPLARKLHDWATSLDPYLD